MPKLRMEPPLPKDRTRYFDLLGACIGAADKAALLALHPEICAFEGGAWIDDFRREWFNRWQHLGLPLEDIPTHWPKSPRGGAPAGVPRATK